MSAATHTHPTAGRQPETNRSGFAASAASTVFWEASDACRLVRMAWLAWAAACGSGMNLPTMPAMVLASSSPPVRGSMAILIASLGIGHDLHAALPQAMDRNTDKGFGRIHEGGRGRPVETVHNLVGIHDAPGRGQ